MNKASTAKKKLSSEQREELLTVLEARFQKNMNRQRVLRAAEVFVTTVKR